MAAARKKLKDAKIASLSLDSKFQLAFSAAYGFALAALRNAGYRAKNRYVVFQSLGTTLSLPKPMVMVLDQCHRKRNLAE